MRAMVLAAGLGTRLRPITYEMPKPMVPVLNRPVMEHILRLLARHGFTETIANLHWFPELIEGSLRRRLGSSGSSSTYSHEEQLLGTSGGVRNAADFLGDSFLIISGDALTDIDLTRDARVPRVPRRDRHPGDQAGRGHEPVRRRDHRLRRPHPGLPGEARPRRSAVRPRQLRHLHVPRGDLRLLPRAGDQQGCRARRPAPASPTGRWTSSRACWRATCPSTRTRSMPTGTTSATSRSCARARSTRSTARSRSSARESSVDGFRSGDPVGDEGDLVGPVLLGAGCEIGEDVRIDGPSVIGEGVKIGAGSRLREVIALPGAEIPGGSVLIGAIAGAAFLTNPEGGHRYPSA